MSKRKPSLLPRAGATTQLVAGLEERDRSCPSAARRAAVPSPAIPPPTTTRAALGAHERDSRRRDAEKGAGGKGGFDTVGDADARRAGGVDAAARKLGEEVVRGGDGGPAVGREMRDDGCRGGEVGVDPIEHGGPRPLRRRASRG